MALLLDFFLIGQTMWRTAQAYTQTWA